MFLRRSLRLFVPERIVRETTFFADELGVVTATTKSGAKVSTRNWVASHGVGDRELVAGIQGDPTYLIVDAVDDGNNVLRNYGLNSICTHLGCVVPWNKAANKFICPCHGSQYDETGKVVRGPAPLSLALAHIVDDGGDVKFKQWTETDFRTGLDPWWA